MPVATLDIIRRKVCMRQALKRVRALVPRNACDRPARRRQELASAIPFKVPQGAVVKHRYQASTAVGRVPPRCPKKRPHRPLRGRCLLLLMLQYVV